MSTFTYEFDVKGGEEFIRACQEMPGAIQDGLKLVTQFLRTLTVERTPWVTGRTAGAWSSIEPVDGGYSFGNPLEHTEGLEIGFEKVKNPKNTIPMNGRFFSKQAPGGIIKPLLDNEAIMDRAVTMFMEAVVRRFNAGA
jgi:hypothetical protein